MLRITIAAFALLVWSSGPVLAQGENGNPDMTIDQMGALIEAVGNEIRRPAEGQWRFHIESIPVFVVTDTRADRMRILTGIANTKNLSPVLYERLMQANFDTTLVDTI